METTKPIKRSPQLVPLSREHHDGLLCCWKINTAVNNSVAPERILPFVLHFFDNNLTPHFAEEEQLVFPLLAPDNADVQEAIAHHDVMRRMIASFRNSSAVTALSLKYFASVLETHIRYEERMLFNIIEREADPVAFESLGEKLSSQACSLEWKDQFWLKEK